MIMESDMSIDELFGAVEDNIRAMY